MRATLKAYGGLNGHGKTHFCVHSAVRRMNALYKKDPSIRFASNIRIMNVPWLDRVVQYKSLKEIIFLTHAIVVIDEVQDQVDNRDFMNTDKMLIKFFEQHRHQSLEIYMTTQVFRKVDIKIRELFQEAWEVRKISGVEKKWCIYRKYKLDVSRIATAPDMDRIPLSFGGGLPRFGWVFKNQKALYNTWEDSALIPFRCDIWLKPKPKSKKILAEIKSNY